jgi:glycosyltransferase involved in cell wall biosynthesis
MADTPLVSVVVPTFRRPHYLREAIASVIAQREPDWEMLVCDDGADDRNREVVEAFGDPRIAYRRNPRRLGIGANKFTGWQAAGGRYVANLDDDDLWEPDFLSTLVPVLEADPTVNIAFSSHHVIDTEGSIDEQETERIEHLYRGGLAAGRHEPFARLALVDQAIPVTMGSVIRRAAVSWGEFAPETDVVADFWLAYLIAREAGAAYYCPQRLTRYRVHPESATATTPGWNESFAACYRRLLADPGMKDLHSVFRTRLADYERRAAVVQVRAGQPAEARRASRRALAARVDPRTVAVAALTHTGPLGRRVAQRWP